MSNAKDEISNLDYLIERIKVHSTIAFNFTYEHDGRDSVYHDEVTADGSTNEFFQNSRPKSIFHALITFLGLPSRIGDDDFSWLQFGRNLIGGWNPLPRDREDYFIGGDFNLKNWLNILGSIFLIKSILIPVFKILTFPVKFLLNILKLGTEFFPKLFSELFHETSTYFYHAASAFDKTGASFGIKEMVLLAISLIIFLLGFSFNIVHKLGMVLTSPDKSRRYWYKNGDHLSDVTLLDFIPHSNVIFPLILSLLSITVSILVWAVTFPLAVSALTTFFPVIIPLVTALAKLSYIATTLTIISGKIITVSTLIAGIFSPAIFAMTTVATAVGIHITATSLAVGFTLGAIAAPIAIALTYALDKASNWWATFKGADAYQPLTDLIESIRVTRNNPTYTAEDMAKFSPTLIDELFNIHSPQYDANVCSKIAEYLYYCLFRSGRFSVGDNGEDRIQFAKTLENHIYQHRDKSIFKERLSEFSQQMVRLRKNDTLREKIPNEATPNWKDIIYSARYTRLISTRSTQLHVNIDSTLPIDFASRQKQSTTVNISSTDSPASNVATRVGTTFFTNSQNVLARYDKSTIDPNLSIVPISNSCFAAYHSVNQQTGRIHLAMADGLGGNTGNKNDDARISRASYFGCKHAIRLCSRHYDPSELKENFEKIIQHVIEEIKIKNRGIYKSISLICASVYKGPGDNVLEVAGVNISENLLVAWNPNTKTVETILPRLKLVSDNPNTDTECNIVHKALTHGTVLIPFSNDMLGIFNTITREEERNGKKYYVSEINPNWIIPILRPLPANASSKDIVQTLMQHVMAQAETDRKALINQSNIIPDNAISYGGDASVMALRLQ